MSAVSAVSDDVVPIVVTSLVTWVVWLILRPWIRGPR